MPRSRGTESIYPGAKPRRSGFAGDHPGADLALQDRSGGAEKDGRHRADDSAVGGRGACRGFDWRFGERAWSAVWYQRSGVSSQASIEWGCCPSLFRSFGIKDLATAATLGL